MTRLQRRVVIRSAEREVVREACAEPPRGKVRRRRSRSAEVSARPGRPAVLPRQRPRSRFHRRWRRRRGAHRQRCGRLPWSALRTAMLITVAARRRANRTARRDRGTTRRGGSRKTLTWSRRPDHLFDQPPRVGIGADDRDAPAGGVEVGGGRRCVKRNTTKVPAAEQVRDQSGQRRIAGHHDSGAAGIAVVGGQRPGAGAVVENRATHRAPSDHDVEASGAQFGADGLIADDNDVVAAFGHRNLVRAHPRRAIGPSRLTSVKNAASGANPATWTS